MRPARRGIPELWGGGEARRSLDGCVYIQARGVGLEIDMRSARGEFGALAMGSVGNTGMDDPRVFFFYTRP